MTSNKVIGQHLVPSTIQMTRQPVLQQRTLSTTATYRTQVDEAVLPTVA
jgi:hypothetical protein